MTSYVVDASIVIQHVVPDTYTVNADELFAQLGTTLTLHVPEFCLLECANVLWKQVRFHNLTQSEAEDLLDALTGLPLTIIQVMELLPRSLEIGLAHQLAVYDSLYIAMAERLGLPLITADTKQETAARTLGIAITPIADFK